jgi:hypothetical protein
VRWMAAVGVVFAAWCACTWAAVRDELVQDEAKWIKNEERA